MSCKLVFIYDTKTYLTFFSGYYDPDFIIKIDIDDMKIWYDVLSAENIALLYQEYMGTDNDSNWDMLYSFSILNLIVDYRKPKDILMSWAVFVVEKYLVMLNLFIDHPGSTDGFLFLLIVLSRQL